MKAASHDLVSGTQFRAVFKLGFHRVQGLGFRVQGLGFGVYFALPYLHDLPRVHRDVVAHVEFESNV